MFKNYVTIALRNFRQHKAFSLINIAGLTIGISASLVIFLIVAYDFGFDKFEKDGDRIYRVVSNMHFPDQDFKNSGVPMPLPPAVTKELTGIETAVPFYLGGDMTVAVQSADDKQTEFKKQPAIIYANNNYFKLLPYQWLAGSPQKSLAEPFAVVLAESRARAYFPSQDVAKDLGKIITYNDSIKATVTGIVKDLDERSDFTFKEFISYATLENSGLKYNTGLYEWGSINSASQFFIKLRRGVQPKTLEKQINDVRTRNEKNAYLKTVHYLQPLSDIHFNADYDNFDQRLAHRSTLYGLLVVAAVLLLLGCINFINLTTAQSVQRAKEIGIRKTMGSSKGQLVFQFLSETFLFTFLATVLSLLLVPFLLKLFADFIPPDVDAGMMKQPLFLFFLLLLMLSVTALAGFYPSLVLSAHKPVTVLKNQTFSGSIKTRRAWLRKSLTVVQFMAAQAFVMGTVIVGKQIHYALNKDLGFRKDGILIVETPSDPKEAGKAQALLHKYEAVPEIEKAVLAGNAPAAAGVSMSTVKFTNGKKEVETTVEVKNADTGYFRLYKMGLIAGRYPLPSDSTTEYVINENYARFLGFGNPGDAVGKLLNGQTPIVGVLRDFHPYSLHRPIQPLVYVSQRKGYNRLHVLLKPAGTGESWKTAIGKMQEAWKQVYPDEDFTYEFFDERIAKFYESERATSTLLKWATALAVIISCLGLFGLVIYTTNQRRKEIGVRKVLGATVSQIVSLLSKDFLKLVLVAFFMATPLAWWGATRWLQDFAYRTALPWWVFLLSGLLMAVMAVVTLSLQIVKAAVANPVKSLRTE